jgi:hypothetical protein
MFRPKTDNNMNAAFTCNQRPAVMPCPPRRLKTQMLSANSSVSQQPVKNTVFLRSFTVKTSVFRMRLFRGAGKPPGVVAVRELGSFERSSTA